MSAPSAVLKAVDDFKAMFEEIDDEYLRERQKDIVDVGNRLLRKITSYERVFRSRCRCHLMCKGH